VTAVLVQDTDKTAPPTNDEIKTFVSAIAVVLGETVAGFEQTVARITDLTTIRQRSADRDLVVALQDFDRLQQEFATLSEILAKLSALSGAGALVNGADPAHPVLAMISIAALKDRLARQLRDLTADLSHSETSDEVIF
jgi:hypothetical protein